MTGVDNPQQPQLRKTLLMHRVIMDNKCSTENQITNTVGISCERVENILHNECLRFLQVRCHIFWYFTKSWPGWPCHKQTWLFLKQTKPVPLTVFSKDDCTVHQILAKLKDNLCSGSTLAQPPKKVKVGKVMCIVFIDYLQEVRTINRE